MLILKKIVEFLSCPSIEAVRAKDIEIGLWYGEVRMKDMKIYNLKNKLEGIEKRNSTCSHQFFQSSCPRYKAGRTEFLTIDSKYFWKQKPIVDAPTNFSVGDVVECTSVVLGYQEGKRDQIKYIGNVFLGGVNKYGVKMGSAIFSMELFENSFKLYEKEIVCYTTTISEDVKDALEQYEKFFSEIELSDITSAFKSAGEALYPSAVKFGEAIKESMTEGDVAFSSRFMPNVKFKTEGHFDELSNIGIYTCSKYLNTRHDGIISMVTLTAPEKTVSIYEAIPELVPEGMIYDRESETLKPVAEVEKYPSDFARRLAEDQPFCALEVEYVIRFFGKTRAKLILDMLAETGNQIDLIHPISLDD